MTTSLQRMTRIPRQERCAKTITLVHANAVQGLGPNTGASRAFERLWHHNAGPNIACIDDALILHAVIEIGRQPYGCRFEIEDEFRAEATSREHAIEFRRRMVHAFGQISRLTPGDSLKRDLAEILVDNCPIANLSRSGDRQRRIERALRDGRIIVFPYKTEEQRGIDRFQDHMSAQPADDDEDEFDMLAFKSGMQIPSRDFVAKLSELVFGYTFGGIGIDHVSEKQFRSSLIEIEFVQQLARSISFAESSLDPNTAISMAAQAACDFFDETKRIKSAARRDALATHRRDPASRNPMDVPLMYPGIKATTVYRFANVLEKLEGFDLGPVPRMMCEYVHEKTGIDIHPGASIGDEFSMDHGTGVVIGETVEIGNRVAMFAGVVLGSGRVDPDANSMRRHPKIEEDVVLYSNATLLGPMTVCRGATIGAGTFIINKDVLPYRTARLINGRTEIDFQI